MPEVGVALALRQQNKLFKKNEEKRIRKRRQKASSGSHTRNKSRRRIPQNEPPPSSWVNQLIEGASIYGLCLYLPGFVGRIVRWYQGSFETNGIFYQLALKSCSSYWFSSLQWCIKNNQQSSSMSVLAPDAEISDVAIVVFLCSFMAVVRLSLVHFLVPNYNQPKRLEALVRCKSVHLLSSSYPGTVTPRPSLKGRALNIDTTALMLAIPSVDDDDDAVPPEETPRSDLRPKQLFGSSPFHDDLLDSDHDDSNEEDANYGLSLDDGLEMEEVVPEQAEDVSTAPAVSSGLLTSSSALSLQALLRTAAPTNAPASRRESLSHTPEDRDRIFAAPKFATATFRMIFCSASCIIAMIYFKDAEFWPPAVGGTGSTKACWDLSSVGATVMEADFDKHNALLRRYYLVQLSYHFHSAAFHILAALLLWFVSSTKDSNRNQESKILGIFPAELWTLPNMQSLFQHCFAVGMMTFSYLFSSLRRLGVIAMFSFDLSSWFLHLLQMSINAPQRSNRFRMTPFRVRLLHRGFVVPMFCYCRFYIFPFVVGYSALEESQDWLRQLENMLAPGTAKYIHGIFVVSFCVLMLISIVYARRLLYHPHIKEALDRLT